MRFTGIISKIAIKIGNFYFERCGNQSSSNLFSKLVMILKEICTRLEFFDREFSRNPPSPNGILKLPRVM